MLNNIINDDRREIINDVMKILRYEWYTFLIELQTWFNDIITQYINWVSVC